jgi:N-acetylglutamate synthase-like GNAT family acetyltransferase
VAARAERVRIRAARPSDAPALARVMRAAIRGLAAGTCTDRQLAAWSSLPALYHRWAMTAGGEAYVVAVDGGRAVGYAARRGREVTAAFVSPARARAGVGASLVARVEEDALRAGLRSLFVLAAPGAVPFYEALGYRGGRRVRVPLPGGEHLAARRLTKRLTRTARPRRASPP